MIIIDFFLPVLHSTYIYIYIIDCFRNEYLFNFLFLKILKKKNEVLVG